ncbi:MAG: L-dopachrome tautomerase-related protein [Ktedonobacteraceae bacterium]
MVQHIFSQEKPVGDLDLVMAFEGPMPTGVSVSHSGRIFVNFPRWDDPVDFTVAELREEKLHPYPNAEMQRTDTSDHSSVLLSVQSVVIDPLDRLWILDTGAPQHRTTSYGGPKLVGVDLAQNRVIKTILFPREVAFSTTYLNDMRFDLRRGEQGMAFITDSSAQNNGIIVVDLASGQSWRRLHEHPSTKAEKGFLPVVEGQPFMLRPPDGPPQPYRSGVDGIAISNDGARLFYSPLMGRRLFSVSSDALVNRAIDDATVATTIVDEGEKGGGGDGMESDAANGVYTTNYEHNAILRRQPDGLYETLVHDPRLLWPDTLSLATNGYLYFTVNQLHRGPRFQRGKDLRERPFGLFRVRVDASPVLLR